MALGILLTGLGYSLWQHDPQLHQGPFEGPPLAAELVPEPEPQPDLQHATQLSSLPTDFVIDSSKERLLFSQLEAGDREWLPRAVPIPGGGTRYTYKRLASDPPLSLEQIKALILNPPSFAPERRAISLLLRELRLAGARVVLGPPRKLGAAGEWEPRRRLLRIRPDVPGKGSREFARVLNHEAIHVAQSCRNGSVQAMPALLGISRAVDPRQLRNLAAPIYANATPRERALEEEAYANQADLSQGPRLLTLYCRGR